MGIRRRWIVSTKCSVDLLVRLQLIKITIVSAAKHYSKIKVLKGRKDADA
jgi:hypothetical protein